MTHEVFAWLELIQVLKDCEICSIPKIHAADYFF